MYDELVNALRAADARPCSDLDCPGSGECPTVGCLFREAADAIEKLVLELDKTTNSEFKANWIPVTERLPEEQQDVLVYLKRGGCAVDYFIPSRNDKWGYRDVTHWQPLPQPPKEDSE